MSLRSAIASALRKTGLIPTPDAPAPKPPPKPAPAAPTVRHDPIPEPSDFPDARYVIVVESIPRRYAGRTASILNKTRLWSERGVASEIVVLGYSAELDETRRDMVERGALGDHVRVFSIYDLIDDGSTPPVVVPVPPSGDEGLRPEPDPEHDAVRYSDGERCVLVKKFDRDGGLLLRDEVDADGALVRRDEYGPGGRLRRTTRYDPPSEKPSEELFYRANGALRFRRVRTVAPENPKQVSDLVTLFDADGAEAGTEPWVDFIHTLLDRLVGDEQTFLTSEARLADALVLSWRRPHVTQLFVLHNPHILPPYDDPQKIRGGFRPLFRQRADVGATVFLTDAQRADAEAKYGRTDNWVVIPHAARRVDASGDVTRDPRLVVMMARLHPQKQLDHAIRAFALVLTRVPDARLEIYGQGEERERLQSLIDDLGVGASVVLAGYTTNPDETYQRAAVSMLTSVYEALPLTPVESMANGCPVVSYDLKYGPSDIITDGVDGFLVPAGDIDAMAERVVRLLTDQELRDRFAAAGTRVHERFSEDVFLARWAGLFNRLRASRRLRPEGG